MEFNFMELLAKIRSMITEFALTGQVYQVRYYDERLFDHHPSSTILYLEWIKDLDREEETSQETSRWVLYCPPSAKLAAWLI